MKIPIKKLSGELEIDDSVVMVNTLENLTILWYILIIKYICKNEDIGVDNYEKNCFIR